ncbi:MAG TPA: hypothetical protein VJ302_34730 [Blastocatellia bacterium]|nr:hypothetical protein [Blastocatellia bacterium]
MVGLNGNGPLILVFGGLLGLLPYGLWKLRGDDSGSSRDWYWPAAAAVIGIAGGGLGGYLVRAADSPAEGGLDSYWYNWLAVGLGAVVSGLLVYREHRGRAQRCDCCQQVLGHNPQPCPRNDHWVCAKCWRPELLRCIDCERLRTPLLALEEDEWWDERVGGRLSLGRCSRCNLTAEERDLRRCGGCTWPMCTDCWDQENGSCVRCSWIIPDLPEPLAKSLAVFQPFETSSAKRRGGD